jgi:exopolyphosphatase/guanosine-5'-triphosphate,3'-diphosphate pyrophosphatase
LKQEEIYHLYKRLRSMTAEERMQLLFLSPDRADVIVPAGKIFSSVMKWSGAQVAFVPKIGVSDGLIKLLYQNHKLDNAFT